VVDDQTDKISVFMQAADQAFQEPLPLTPVGICIGKFRLAAQLFYLLADRSSRLGVQIVQTFLDCFDQGQKNIFIAAKLLAGKDADLNQNMVVSGQITALFPSKILSDQSTFSASLRINHKMAAHGRILAPLIKNFHNAFFSQSRQRTTFWKQLVIKRSNTHHITSSDGKLVG